MAALRTIVRVLDGEFKGCDQVGVIVIELDLSGGKRQIQHFGFGMAAESGLPELSDEG
jgi:hypothetical protein